MYLVAKRQPGYSAKRKTSNCAGNPSIILESSLPRFLTLSYTFSLLLLSSGTHQAHVGLAVDVRVRRGDDAAARAAQ